MKRSKSRYRQPSVDSGSLRVFDPDRAARLRTLAEAQLEAGDPEAAADVLHRALVLDPLEPTLRYTLGFSLYRSGYLSSALDWLEPFARQGHARIDHLRGLILADLHRDQEAILAFGLALEAKPQLEEVRLLRAALWIANGMPRSAINDLNEVLKNERSSAWALTLRAKAHLELKNPHQAFEDLRTIPDGERTVEQVLLQIQALLMTPGNEQKIEEAFTAAIERFPSDLRLRLTRGRYLVSRSGLEPQASDRAVQVLEEVLESKSIHENPRLSAEAWFLLAELFSTAPDKQDQAEAAFLNGLELQPEDPRGLTGIGSMLYHQGRSSHALPWLLHSVMVDPDRPQTLEALAKALSAIPDDEAVARWIGVITSGLPEQSPTLVTSLLRFVQEAGRLDAYEEVRREGHRMKNLVAVLASRFGSKAEPELQTRLQKLYDEWASFLKRIHLPTPVPSPLSLPALIQRTVEEAVDDSSKVMCVLPPHLPLIQGEIQALCDALANIVRNAVQASPGIRPVRISVRYRPQSRWVEIAIQDEGAGISLEDQKRIFEPGFSRREGGSGLGLTIARRVIMAHGGRISLASAPGGPTTFTVRLPIAAIPLSEPVLGYQTLAFQPRPSDPNNRMGSGSPSLSTNASSRCVDKVSRQNRTGE